MKTLHYLSSPFLLCLLGLMPCIAFAQADGAPKRSPELQVLHRLVGVWDVKVTIKPAGGGETNFDVVSRRSWSFGGTFVRLEDANNLKNPEAKEFQILWTYDPVAKNYPAILMDGPHWGSITGVWDEKTKTMHWKSKMGNGVTGEGQHRFIGKDRAEASGVFRNPEGEIVTETSWSQTRRKAKSPKK